MEDDDRPFLIPVRRRWTFLILPILALVYFAFVVWLGATRTTVRGVSMDVLVLAGLALFLLVAVVEIPFFLRRRVKAPEPEREEWQAEPPEPVVPGALDDEKVSTDETQQGLRVLEYSSPAKSRNRGAVYAKTYVPVTKEHVLRVETLAAEPREL